MGIPAASHLSRRERAARPSRRASPPKATPRHRALPLSSANSSCCGGALIVSDNLTEKDDSFMDHIDNVRFSIEGDTIKRGTIVIVKPVVTLVVAVAIMSMPQTAIASSNETSIDRARLLQRYGLMREAKAELIDVLFDEHMDDESKATAYYLLGNISFKEGKILIALESWRDLVEQYPESTQAKTVRDEIDKLSQIVEESSESHVDNAIANAYLRHGDFWSKGKQDRFSIDSSWISNVDAALKWYDKVIEEFPQTGAARRAYEEKLRTVLGWKDPGQYGSKHGLKESFGRYIRLLTRTFSDFENDFPEASTLQAFRFQIAQAYWKNRDWKNTKEWLNTIISESGDNDNFYRDLAQRRLKKIEY